MTTKCTHLDQINEDVVRQTGGCEECLKTGGTWVHLRVCLTCGHVGCCDSSEGKHAHKHWEETGHPLIESGQPGEHWRWCYIDDDFV